MGATIFSDIFYLRTIHDRFLMARLYLESLITKITRRKIKAALNTLPEGLYEIYDEMMKRIQLQNPKDHADLAVKVLGWIFFTLRPLTIQEVQHALAIEPGDDDLDESGIPSVDLLISVCAGMVTVNEESNTISLVHYTAQEYFQQGGIKAFQAISTEVAQVCLTQLCFNSLEESTSQIADVAEAAVALRDINPLLAYAAQHWGDHVQHAKDSITIRMAVGFLEKEHLVNLTVYLKDFEDCQLKGTYFRSRSGVTGLSLAALFGLTQVLADLIVLNSDIERQDSNGQNPLHHAAIQGHKTTAELLLNHHSPVNAKDDRGWTALHQSAANGHQDLVSLLLQRGADIDSIDHYHGTPLYRASENGFKDTVVLLIRSHAKIDLKNMFLQTALHRAADCGYGEVVTVLLNAGADAGLKDHYGYTPFYRAADQLHDEVKTLLFEHSKKFKEG